jgi:hypothetical protein
MSDSRSRGWDGPTDPADALPLCGYHEVTTERLSTFHAAQIARQCPQCVATIRQA